MHYESGYLRGMRDAVDLLRYLSAEAAEKSESYDVHAWADGGLRVVLDDLERRIRVKSAIRTFDYLGLTRTEPEPQQLIVEPAR